MESGGGRRRFSGMLPFLAVHVANEYYKSSAKPPVTAGLIAANTLIHLRPGFLDNILPTLSDVWFNPHLIIKHRDLKRFFLSAFYHIGESHLVYNMMSLLWKGIQLETAMGSVEFASMVTVLLAMSQGITLMLAKTLLLFFDYERAYYYEHAVGFSGVLFAMKVVLNSESDNDTWVHGLIVQKRYAAWAELILLQMFVPGVSFLGHLGGILAGILYLKLKSSYRGPDPLMSTFRCLTDLLKWPLKFVKGLFSSRHRRISGRGTVGGTVGGGYTGRNLYGGPWTCAVCTYDNSELLTYCEVCSTARGARGNHGRTHDLSSEEVRQRRIERLGGR